MPLPAPATWTDGEQPDNMPTADNLNLDWRDSFNFLLGNTRPFIYLHQSTQQALTANVFSPMAWQVELAKRGGMVHTTNSTDITVPYTGQYVGFCMIGLLSFSSTATRVVTLIQVNGANAGRFDLSPPVTNALELHGSITLNLQANDVVTVQVRNTSGTVSTSNLALNRSRIALWYTGD